MRKPRIILNFGRLKEGDLSVRSKFIILSMTGNANFANPTPTIAAVTTAQQAYDNSLVAAVSGDSQKIKVKNDRKDALIALLVQLASYVTMVANDNRTIMGSSGFELNSQYSSSSTLGDIENVFVLTNNTPRTIFVSCDAVANAIAYVFGYTSDENPNSNSIWVEVTVSTSSYTFTGLETSKWYNFRIKASGRNNQSTEIQPIKALVL
jgi:hypothetical protein